MVCERNTDNSAASDCQSRQIPGTLNFHTNRFYITLRWHIRVYVELTVLCTNIDIYIYEYDYCGMVVTIAKKRLEW